MFRNLNEKELQKWEEVNENINVTAYLADRRSQDNAEHVVKNDFCESFALFAEIPGLLAVISPDRYNYMTELFKNHDESLLADKKRQEREIDVKNYKEQMDSLGWNEERIRKHYTGYPLGWLPNTAKQYAE